MYISNVHPAPFTFPNAPLLTTERFSSSQTFAGPGQISDKHRRAYEGLGFTPSNFESLKLKLKY